MTHVPPPEQKSARRPITGRARAVAVTANRGAYWISRHWLFLFNLAVAIYIGLPFLAPVLMRAGVERPADLIYKVYSPACHQMGFRSWFLFGEQSYYPLEATKLPHAHYFEVYVQDDPAFAGMDSSADFFRYSWVARSFVGNERMGYKIALCQRCVGTYLALLLGGLLFALLRRRLRPLPWQLYVLFGILPMLLDGGYQLLTYMTPHVLAPHETIPLLRTITGALFGFGLVWLTYPQIQMGMEETEVDFREKLTRANVIREA